MVKINSSWINSIKLRWKFDWKYIPRDIKIGIKNIFKWISIIWNDRDWDYTSLLDMMEFKLNNMANLHDKNKRYVNYDINVRRMKIAKKLINRIRNQYYLDEFMNYHDTSYELIKDDEHKDSNGNSMYRLETTLISENFDDYFKRYPREFNKIKSENENDKKLAMLLSMRIHNKAKRLLFDILNDNIDGWWD